MSELRGRLNAALSLYLDRDSAGLAGALLLRGQKRAGGHETRLLTYRRVAPSGAERSASHNNLRNTRRCSAEAQNTETGADCHNVGLHSAVPDPYRMSVFGAESGNNVCYLRDGLFLFRRGKDRITALFIAGAGILLVDPAAIYDIGFMMSFTSTLGVVLFTADASRFCSRRLGGHYQKAPFSEESQSRHHRRLRGGRRRDISDTAPDGVFRRGFAADRSGFASAHADL